MDNIYMDTYYFFVPNRLVWEHWKEFMGERKEITSWNPNTEYIVPTILPPQSTGWNTGTIADYLGIPVGIANDNIRINALPFRGYTLIAAEWFLDQNLQDAPQVYTGDTIKRGVNTDNQVTDIQLGGKPFKVAKYHDYFTSALPSPLKGPEIGIFGNRINQENISFNSYVPVTTLPNIANNSTVIETYHSHSSPNSHYYKDVTGSNPYTSKYTPNASSGNGWIPDNLWADVGQMSLTINQLRLAFQLQKFYERQNRSGTRYREVLKAHFSVVTSDARMQIPEYLGGHRFPLSIHQVANQAASSGEFLGDVGAMSNTADVNEDFIKSFEEHGYVFGRFKCRIKIAEKIWKAA